jgi:DNA-binding transcriptional LysR family regulator
LDLALLQWNPQNMQTFFAVLQMDWDDLQYFRAVAETTSLAGAARRLSVNHSTVFRRINRFEKQLGTRLFERLPDGYQLTGAGEEIFWRVSRIGEEIDNIEIKLLGKDFRPSGKVRLTAPDNLAYEYLPRYLVDFSKHFPDIEVDIVVGAENLNLTRREADLAIRATSDPPPHLIGRKLLDVEWAFYASDASSRASRPTSAAELAGHRLIGADGQLARLPAMQGLEAQYSENIVMRCSTLNAMSAMAVAGYGLALLPDDQSKPTLHRLIPYIPVEVSEIWILTHPELRRVERIRLLMEHLIVAFRAVERFNPKGDE